MSYQQIPEPVVDHLADTGPARAVRVESSMPAWRRAAGLLSLLGAMALTVGAAVMILSPVETPPAPVVPTQAGDTQVESIPQATTPPEVVIESQPQQEQPAVGGVDVLPTLSYEQAAALLATPIAQQSSTFGFETVRNSYDAFTIIPDRPRSGVEQYEVQQGDTIFQIAERFGLQPESIAWANDRSIIGALRPGQRINVMPVDGAYHTVLVETTIRELAARYQVDPYAIIDSEYNDLFGAEPDDPLPVGTQVVIPGGIAETITWTPRVERVEAGSGSNSSGVARISFAVGEPGSCGLVDNPGGGGGWIRPLSGYQWVRGFTSYHTGVDLSAPAGTPVIAANGGTVVFAGWNSFGYGYAVVLAHGPFTTLYGHLSSINVGCGQRVGAGQVIGGVGSTGDSSGNHLHFEIRYNDVPTDPTGTMAF